MTFFVQITDGLYSHKNKVIHKFSHGDSLVLMKKTNRTKLKSEKKYEPAINKQGGAVMYFKGTYWFRKPSFMVTQKTSDPLMEVPLLI